MSNSSQADFFQWVKSSGGSQDNNEWFHAAATGKKQTIENLIKQGVVDVDEQVSPLNMLFQAGVTALMLASEKGHADIVDILLKNGANAEIRDGRGHKASQMAIMGGHADVVLLLFNNDVNK